MADNDERKDPMEGTALERRSVPVPEQGATPVIARGLPEILAPRDAPLGIQLLARIKSHGVTATLLALSREYEAGARASLAGMHFLAAWKQYQLAVVEHEHLGDELAHHEKKVATRLHIQEQDVKLEFRRQLKRIEREWREINDEDVDDERLAIEEKQIDPATAYFNEIKEINEIEKTGLAEAEAGGFSSDDIDAFKDAIEAMRQQARARMATRMAARAQQTRKP